MHGHIICEQRRKGKLEKKEKLFSQRWWLCKRQGLQWVSSWIHIPGTMMWLEELTQSFELQRHEGTLLVLYQIKLKWTECSACRLEVRRSEMPGDRFPVQPSFGHRVGILFFLWGPWMTWCSVDITQLPFSSAAGWVLSIALTQSLKVSNGLPGTKEHRVAAGENF